VLTGFQPQELTFMCGKHLSHYRGEHYIRTLFPTQAELTIMLFAGVMIAAPNTPMPQDMAAQIRATAQELAKYIQPVQLEGCAWWSSASSTRAPRPTSSAGTRLSSSRRAARAYRVGRSRGGEEDPERGAAAPGRSLAADKMKELLLYSVSEEYARVRQALGIAGRRVRRAAHASRRPRASSRRPGAVTLPGRSARAQSRDELVCHAVFAAGRRGRCTLRRGTAVRVASRTRRHRGPTQGPMPNPLST
jgi:hypothetical protein